MIVDKAVCHANLVGLVQFQQLVECLGELQDLLDVGEDVINELFVVLIELVDFGIVSL